MEETRSAQGLWKACYQMEVSAALQIEKVLKPFEVPIENLYECGIEVATLNRKTTDMSEGLKIGGIFLKRCLTDLRSIWGLLQIGYTSQAACIAAATFENALLVEAISNDSDKARELSNSELGDTPWSVVNLCKFHAEQARQEAVILVKSFSEKEYELTWMQLYSAYKWLCKIKHPTIPSAIHDMGTSYHNEEYVIMAVPDTREEDIPIKYTILVIVINRIRSAIRNFAFGSDIDYLDEGVKRWLQRFNSILEETVKIYDSDNLGCLPFTVTDKSLIKKFRALSE
ncbi:hypothetical protein [Paenibacillus sp. 79R4]|uniref:hypothetical protein n=1 Tax=Paenibacillus sp. 79R4 TaxID=2212847 RepID=UPI0015BE36F2|nr:hypothetical protein [Paenibacillus sp. 79R4]